MKDDHAPDAKPEMPGDTRPQPVVVKKYANRRLYNTETSSYVTLEDLAAMVRADRDFVVYDAKSGEELTHSVLTQIIVEQESRGTQALLPIGFLRQLIRLYGNSMEALVPRYLEHSLDSLSREQTRFARDFGGVFGASAFEAMAEQTRANMVLFEQALGLFSPFHSPPPGAPPPQAPTEPDPTLDELRLQMARMQAQLDALRRSS